MDAAISAETLGSFFAWAPLILGLLIFLAAWLAKRNEGEAAGMPIGQTFACAKCGRRSVREHMVPQVHQGAVSYVCAKCAGAH